MLFLHGRISVMKNLLKSGIILKFYIVDSNYEIPDWSLEASRKYNKEAARFNFEYWVDLSLMAIPGFAGFTINKYSIIGHGYLRC